MWFKVYFYFVIIDPPYFQQNNQQSVIEPVYFGCVSKASDTTT